jgi:hypothetical protein
MGANFPATAPTVYEDKSIANDVGDSLHWDGGDANQVKAEVIAIALKVGVDNDTNEDSHDYKIRELEGRKQVSAGSGTLANSTTTTVEDESVGTSSTVLVQGTNAGFMGLAPMAYVSAQEEGSFTLTHAQAAGTETFVYLVVN